MTVVDACRNAEELVREYNCEKGRAQRSRDRWNLECRRNRDYGDFMTLGECASDRFHELRKMFGLDPWN